GRESLDDTTLVVDFGSDDPTRHGEAEGRVESGPVLAQPPGSVRRGGRMKRAETAPVPRDECDGDPLSQQGREGLAGDLRALHCDEPVEVAYRNLAQHGDRPLFVLAVDLQPLGDEAHDAAGGGNAGGGHERQDSPDFPGPASRWTSGEVHIPESLTNSPPES